MVLTQPVKLAKKSKQMGTLKSHLTSRYIDQWLKAHVALTEDPGYPMLSSYLHKHEAHTNTRHIHGTHIYMQENTHTYK